MIRIWTLLLILSTISYSFGQSYFIETIDYTDFQDFETKHTNPSEPQYIWRVTKQCKNELLSNEHINAITAIDKDHYFSEFEASHINKNTNLTTWRSQDTAKLEFSEYQQVIENIKKTSIVSLPDGKWLQFDHHIPLLGRYDKSLFPKVLVKGDLVSSNGTNNITTDIKNYFNRCEVLTYVSNGTKYKPDIDHWFGWKVKLDKDFSFTKTHSIIGQWHNPDAYKYYAPGKKDGGVPCISMSTYKDDNGVSKWRFHAIRVNETNEDLSNITFEAETNKVYEFKFHFNFSTTGEGTIEFWCKKEGEANFTKLVDLHNISTHLASVPKDEEGNTVNFTHVYPKIGVYNAGWASMSFNEYREEVIANPNYDSYRKYTDLKFLNKTVSFKDVWASDEPLDKLIEEVNDGKSNRIDNDLCDGTLTNTLSTASAFNVGEQYEYEFEFINQTTLATHTIQSPTSEIDLITDVDFLQKNEVYDVNVRVLGHSVLSHGTQTCELTIPTDFNHSLTGSLCGSQLNLENNTLSSIDVGNNHNYKFRIVDHDFLGDESEVMYFNSNQPELDIFNDLELQKGKSYHIRMRVSDHGILDGYSDACSFDIPESIVPSVTSPLCGGQLSLENRTLTAFNVGNNHNYKFRIVDHDFLGDESEVMYFNSNQPELDIFNDLELQKGKSYHIRMRVSDHGILDGYSDACSFDIPESLPSSLFNNAKKASLENLTSGTSIRYTIEKEKLNLNQMPVSYDVLIAHLNGRIYMKEDNLSGNQNIDISNLQEGIYIVKIISSEGVSAFKFLK